MPDERAAHDRGAAFEPEIHRYAVRTPTTSRTAAADSSSTSRSSSFEVELDDLLDAARAELDRDAHVEAVDPVLALEVRGAREHALLVEHDRVDHLRRRGARRVPGRRAEQVDDLAAALGACARPSRRSGPRATSFVSGTPPTVVALDDRDHLVAVAAEHHRGHVLDRRARLPGDERREAGGVEDAGHRRRRAPSASRRRSSRRGTSRRAGSRRRSGSRPATARRPAR